MCFGFDRVLTKSWFIPIHVVLPSVSLCVFKVTFPLAQNSQHSMKKIKKDKQNEGKGLPIFLSLRFIFVKVNQCSLCFIGNIPSGWGELEDDTPLPCSGDFTSSNNFRR